MKTVTINTASKAYDVVVGADLLDEAGAFIRKAAGGQAAAIVADDIVAELYGKRLSDSLAKSGYRTAQFIFPHGESSKNAENFLSLLSFLAEEKISRADTVVALGGGVTGDLAGFAAASYMRGIRFVQVPTTLLAAVDSSVGGKTAINLAAGKNLAGAFYQPDLVLCDVSTLSTLPPEIFRDGCAEVIKHGMIKDYKLFESLKTPIHAQLEEIIARNVEIKSEIVAEDEFEKGKRKLLNFGHTVAHAIEALSGYRISHGQAVAAGMAIETRVSFRLGLCDKKCLGELLKMLELYELPVNTSYEADELARACLIDKKRDGKYLSMIFPLAVGLCIYKDMPVSELEDLIRYGLEESQ